MAAAIDNPAVPQDYSCCPTSRRQSIWGALWRAISLTVRAACLGIEKSKQRRALRALDDRLLADIGITRQAAEREACKPFWASANAASETCPDECYVGCPEREEALGSLRG